MPSSPTSPIPETTSADHRAGRIAVPQPPEITLVLAAGWEALATVPVDVAIVGPRTDGFRANLTVTRQRFAAPRTAAEVFAEAHAALDDDATVTVDHEKLGTLDGHEALDRRFVQQREHPLRGRVVVVVLPAEVPADVGYYVVLTALADADAAAIVDADIDAMIASVRFGPADRAIGGR